MKIKIDPKSPKKKFQEENVQKRPSKLAGKFQIFVRDKNKKIFIEIIFQKWSSKFRNGRFSLEIGSIFTRNHHLKTLVGFKLYSY